MACTNFAQCLDGCNAGQALCFALCSAQFPGGGQPYVAVAQCVVCDVCVNDCEGEAPPQFCNF